MRQINIECLDVSPQGNIIATGCSNGMAHIWSMEPDPEKRAAMADTLAGFVELEPPSSIYPSPHASST